MLLMVCFAFKKIKSKASIGYSNPSTRYLSKGNELSMSKKYLYPRRHCSTVCNRWKGLLINELI